MKKFPGDAGHCPLASVPLAINDDTTLAFARRFGGAAMTIG
jgi:hypothetical protein